MDKPVAVLGVRVERLCALEPWFLYGFVGLRLTATLLRAGGGPLSERAHGAVYDALGPALLRGEATLPSGIIGCEGFLMPWGRVTYFGWLPSLPRLLLNALWPANFGRWSGLSCVAAACVGVWAARGLADAALARRDDIDAATRCAIRLGVGLLFGLGSPLLALVSDACLFTEAIAWATAFSLLAVGALRTLAPRVDAPVAPHLALSLCAAAALNTRLTFAMPLLLMVGALSVRVLFARASLSPRARAARLLALAAPVALGITLHLIYNRLRWGSALTFIVPDAYALRAPLAEHFARGLFHPRRIPWGALNWALPRPAFFTLSPPFVRPGLAMPVPSPAWGGTAERFLPLPLVAPALLAAAGAGWRTLRGVSPMLRFTVAAFLLQVVALLGYFNIAVRYAAEFLPALLLLAGLGVEGLPRDAQARRRVLAAWGGLAALSVFVHLALWG